MTTKFPEEIDQFENPKPDDSQAKLRSHSQQHGDANDAIEALQRKVGTTNSGDTQSLDFKVGAVENVVEGLGSAAFEPIGTFANAAQGAKADSAVQPAQLDSATSGLQSQIDGLVDGQQTSAIYADTLPDLQAVTGSYVGQGAFVLNGTGAGQYRWDGTVWEFLRADTLAATSKIADRLDAVYRRESLYQFSYSWTCPHPSMEQAKLVAGGIELDGTLRFAAGHFGALRADVLDAHIPAYPRDALGGFAHNVFDGKDAAAGGVSTDGVLTYDSAKLRTLNGYMVDRLVYGPRATFDAELPMLLNYGQSLAAGPVGAITTAQEYDSVCFPAHSTSPSAYAPATAANGSEGGNREIPSFGSCAMTKALILSEEGISFSQQKYQMLIGNAAYGGYSIAQLEKGTAPYAELIGQVQAGYGIAQAAGRRLVVSAMNWVHGPGNFNSGYRYYLARQMKLADDIDSDCRSITKQGRPVYMIVSQSASQGAAFRRPVPLAQLEASLRSDKIILAAPEYMFSYLPDGLQVHITPASTRIMGAYLGLAYKRTIIDGKKWEPLRPEKIDVQGRVIYVRFNRSGLVFDTTLVPAQAQRGFSLVDTLGNDNPLSSIEVVQPDTVRMVAASMPKPGSVLWLGGAAATGIANYSGGASNLRDRQGDTITFDGYPLHNWAAVFAAKIN